MRERVFAIEVGRERRDADGSQILGRHIRCEVLRPHAPQHLLGQLFTHGHLVGRPPDDRLVVDTQQRVPKHQPGFQRVAAARDGSFDADACPRPTGSRRPRHSSALLLPPAKRDVARNEVQPRKRLEIICRQER